MPVMGLNGPCDPVSTFTLALAECIGGAVILSEVLPGVPVGIVPHPQPVDLRTGSMVFGSPEWELLDLMHRDVFAHYGQDWNGKLMLTTAPTPNQQAVLDHATSALAGMLHGCRHFANVGQLSLDDVFSPAMLMLDLDILEHAGRVARGIWTGHGLELDALPALVDEVVRGNMLFGAHESTLANFREQYVTPRVLNRWALKQWEHAGRPDMLAAANEAADKAIATYQYEPPRDVLRDLQRIYDRSRLDLGRTRT